MYIYLGTHFQISLILRKTLFQLNILKLPKKYWIVLRIRKGKNRSLISNNIFLLKISWNNGGLRRPGVVFPTCHCEFKNVDALEIKRVGSQILHKLSK